MPTAHPLHRITFSRPDGSPCQGDYAAAGAHCPSVVVIQEWWGLNAQIGSVVTRFAEAGFNALAPDLFQGRVTQDPDEAQHLMTGLDFHGATFQDIAGAVNYLHGVSPQPVGVMGFCMGGALSIASAVHLSGLSAAVSFYGIPPQDFADPAQLSLPFQGHFARQDGWCTPDSVAALTARMTAAGHPPDLYQYEAAHGFFNATRPAYQATLAEQAWARTLAFFQQHLGGAPLATQAPLPSVRL